MTAIALPAAPTTAPARTERGPVGWATGLVVSYLLLASAISHIGNPYHFLTTIHSYQLVPRAVAEVAAATLPFLHLTIAFALLGGVKVRAAFGLAVLVFLTYAAAQGLTLTRGVKVPCGCFGPGAEATTIGAKSIGLAVGAAALALVGWWASRGERR